MIIKVFSKTQFERPHKLGSSWYTERFWFDLKKIDVDSRESFTNHGIMVGVC